MQKRVYFNIKKGETSVYTRINKSMKKIRNSKDKNTIFDYFNITIIFVLSVICLYPCYLVLITSLNEPVDSLRGGLYFFIRDFTFDNYEFFFRDPVMLRAFTISVARTVIGAVSSVFFTACFAYGVSKKYLIGRKYILAFMLITMYVSGGLIPIFILIKNVGLYKNFLVYIIPLLFSSYNAIIMMTFFKGLPSELDESAKIDGANDLRIFISIVLPMSKALLATIMLFNAVWQWNSWFDTMIFGGKKLMTLQYKLVQIIRDVDAAKKLALQNDAFNKVMGYEPSLEAVKATAMAVTIIPILMVYPFLQKYFVKGVMIGSLKG